MNVFFSALLLAGYNYIVTAKDEILIFSGGKLIKVIPLKKN